MNTQVSALPFYRSETAARQGGYAAIRAAELTRLAAPVLAAYRPSKELTQTPGKRTAMVQDAGGSGLDKAEREARRIEAAANLEARSQADYELAGNRWNARKALPPASDTLRDYIFRSHKVGSIAPDTRADVVVPTITLADGSVIPDPDMLQCSYCDSFVHRSKATLGVGPLSKVYKQDIIEILGIKVVSPNRRAVHFSNKLIACQDHCLELAKAHTFITRNGRVVDRSPKTRFPETKG